MRRDNATQAPNDNAMHFTKQSFMGIELDILLGHPEHDILFIATQVARAAGLKNPKTAAGNFKHNSGKCTFSISLEEATKGYQIPVPLPKDASGKTFQRHTTLFDEANVYRMLLRGHAPASEPFRKWVTEVVLPSIRKTGKFDINEAQDATSQQFAGEFAALHAEIAGLKAMLKELLERPVAVVAEAVESPYEG